MNDIDMPFTALKQQIDRLETAVDKCFMPGIYVHTYKIASIIEKIKPINLTESQKKVFNKLDEEAIKQFERISKGRCSCSVVNGI